MNSSRLFSVLFVVGVSTGAAVVACGGDDGGGGGTTDAPKQFMDAKVFMDAPPAMGLGQACTPPMGMVGQGDCPAGFTCLTLQGGAGSWCSKTCTRGSGDMCGVGYTGPGIPVCIYDITFGSGGSAMPFCGVVCAGAVCGSACNGTCPGALQCNTSFGSGSSSGSACK